MLYCPDFQFLFFYWSTIANWKVILLGDFWNWKSLEFNKLLELRHFPGFLENKNMNSWALPTKHSCQKHFFKTFVSSDANALLYSYNKIIGKIRFYQTPGEN